MTTTAPALARLGTRPRVIDYLRSIWARREFAVEIPRAALQAQHRNTVLGGLWHLLDPIILVGVYYVVFGIVLDVSRGVDNLVGFLAIGVFVYHFTTKSLRAGSKSITSNEGLVRAIAFPRAILPLSQVMAEFLALGYALIAMFAVVLATGEEPAWTWLLIFPIIVIQFVFNLGAAMFFARLADHFRDITQVLPYTLRIIGYMSGVFIPMERRLADYPELLTLMQWNPFFLIMEMPREAILDNVVPPARDWAVFAAWGVVSLIIGFAFFLRREHEYGRG